MHIISVPFPPAELATRLTEPRVPAQRSKSASSDSSLAVSLRIHRISVPLRAAKPHSISAGIVLIGIAGRMTCEKFGTFLASSMFA